MKARILACCLLLAGCSKNDDLAACLATTEQLILLRQLAAPEKIKKNLNDCREMAFGDDYCKGLYLNANTPVYGFVWNRKD